MQTEERLTINTPDDIEVTMRIAGVASRCTAAVLDLFIISFLIMLITPFLAFAGSFGFLLAWACTLAVIVGYPAGFELMRGGRTPGKSTMGIYVAMESGLPLTLDAVLIRSTLRFFETPVFGAFILLAIILSDAAGDPSMSPSGDPADSPAILWMLVAAAPMSIALMMSNKRRKRVGDFLAGTVVLAAPRVEPGTGYLAIATRPYGLEPWDVSGLRPEDELLLRRFLERRNTMKLASRAALAYDLATYVRPRIMGPPPYDPHPEYLIEGIVLAASVRSQQLYTDVAAKRYAQLYGQWQQAQPAQYAGYYPYSQPYPVGIAHPPPPNWPQGHGPQGPYQQPPTYPYAG